LVCTMASWLRREAMRSSVRAMDSASQPLRLRSRALRIWSL
jgi:hypothetical protein